MPESRVVLFLHSSDELYGSDRVLLDVVSGFLRQGYQAVVVLPTDRPEPGRLKPRLEQAGAEVLKRPLAVMRRQYYSPLGALTFIWRLGGDIVMLSALIRSRGIDLIYTNTAAVIVGVIIGRLCRRPHIWHVHEIVAASPVAPLLHWLLRDGNTVLVAVSQAVARSLPSAARISVVHNAITEAPIRGKPLRERLLKGASGPLVGYVGRISSWKGHEVFLELVRRVHRELPAARFIMAGGPVPGQEGLVLEMVRELRDPELACVDYLGEVENGPELVASLDILVSCPTRPDPFPRVVEEAQWHGVPVLGVAVGGIPELVVHGETGLLCPIGDMDALREGLRQMADGSLLACMSAKAQQRAQSVFRTDVFFGSLLAIAESVLPSK